MDPSDGFGGHSPLESPPPIGRQEYDFRLVDAAAFRNEIAPARTFGFVKEIETLEEMGLANGGRLNNFILVGDEGVVNAPLRFPDEFVRHKILDVLGDFYLLGRPIRGRVVARKTGHCDNAALLRILRERFGLPALRGAYRPPRAAQGASGRQLDTRGSPPATHTTASTLRRTRPAPATARTRKCCARSVHDGRSSHVTTVSARRATMSCAFSGSPSHASST